MTKIILFTATIALFVSAPSNASVLHFQNIPRDWKSHVLPPGSPEAKAANDAEAILNFQEHGETVKATVYVREFPAPDESLANDTSAWRRVLFSQPATVKPIIIEERVLSVGGRPRYVLYFETPSDIHLQTVLMATVTNGKLEVLYIEHDAETVAKVRAPVMDLYKKIAILSSSK